MNRRQWLGYVLAAMPLLCLPVVVAGATTTPKHPHDALLHRLGYTNAKQRLIRYVSVQHGKLVDADFDQPAPFYDRVLTFWEGSRGVCIVQDYVGSDEKLTAYYKLCFGSTMGVVYLYDAPVSQAELMSWGDVPPQLHMGYPHLAPTSEHPHAEWMRRNLGVQGAVLVSLDERPLRLVGLPTTVSSTTVWRDRNNGDKDHLIVQVGDQYSAGYFDMAGWR